MDQNKMDENKINQTKIDQSDATKTEADCILQITEKGLQEAAQLLKKYQIADWKA